MAGPGSALDRPGAATLALYGLPGLPLAIVLLPFYVYLPTYYAVDVGLGFAIVGAVVVAARLWDLVTDPVIGMLSDRLSTRLGRRRPWMLAGTAIAVASVWPLFDPSASSGWLALLAWSMALTLAMTMVQLPHAAWGAELSPDYGVRSRITGVRESFAVLGTLLAAGIPALLGLDRDASLESLAWLLTATLPPAVVAACVLVPEPPMARAARAASRLGLGPLKRNGPFRRLIVAYFLNGVANGLPASLFLLYVERVLRTPEWSGGLLFVYFLCGVAAVPLWLRLSDRFGKHRVWCMAMAATCAAFAWVPLLAAGDLSWFLLICAITGMGLGADLALPPSMQADVIDLDRLRTGQDRAGLYFGLWGVATKLALALAVGIAFPLLEIVPAGGGADTSAGPPPWLIAALYSLAPIAFKLVAIGLLWRFPITARRQHAIRARIARMRGNPAQVAS